MLLESGVLFVFVYATARVAAGDWKCAAASGKNDMYRSEVYYADWNCV